jgi:hypothetical protein
MLRGDDVSPQSRQCCESHCCQLDELIAARADLTCIRVDIAPRPVINRFGAVGIGLMVAGHVVPCRFTYGSTGWLF